MPLRRRISMVAAAAVAIVIVLVAAVSYVVVREQLRSQVDGALQGQALLVEHFGGRAFAGDLPGLPAGEGGPAPYAQVVTADGTVSSLQGYATLPVDAAARAVAANGGTVFEDVSVGGVHVRVYTIGIQNVAVQLGRPLSSVDHVLAHVRLILVLLCLGGIALAGALGRIAARRVLAPLAEVAQTAQHISETEDLSSRIAIHADDEVGQLATRFNAMLERLEGSRDALDDSVRAQRQLVADASHELRTPVTSLRTNVEVLLAGGELSPEDRDRLLTDVVEQSEELSALVGDLIELARGDEPSGTPEDVRLDGVVAESIARGRRNSPGIRFEARLEPTIVEGVPERLGRAINNLLDNAARHSPSDGTVEVTVDADGVLVRDHGPGIAPGDVPYVFDRFFRGENSRGRQGSGLGLAIVRQVAEQHGGSVSAANAPDGGAMFRLHLPSTPAERTGAGGKNEREYPEAVDALW
jgi:two-component system, OmpR family, sensor histidine kinase MprB